jgi:phosphatidylethanolamine/phosphatidyl-N-methylethanolamine N-methyltransferase
MQQNATLQKLDSTDVRKAYRRWAPVYDQTFGKFVEVGVRQATELINAYDGKLLDVGVGTGLALPHYGDQFKVTGVDLSPHMLVKARERAEASGKLNVETLVEMDATALRFASNSFDIATAMYVMTVVPDPVAVMLEMARVVKPGGHVVIVSHFSSEGGLMGAIEKVMARHAAKLGWRPEFPMETLLVSPDLRLVHSEKVRPFGFFTLLQFRKSG